MPQYIYTVIANNGLMYAFYRKRDALRFMQPGCKYSERYSYVDYLTLYEAE